MVTPASSHRPGLRCGVTSNANTTASDGPSLATGLRVIEIGESIAAATAGMVLSDYGADVWVIEPPGGSRLRGLPAHPMWARGKRSVPLDLTAADGRAAAPELARGADVAIVALAAATADPPRAGAGGRSALGAARGPAAAAPPARAPAAAEGGGRAGGSLIAVNPGLVHC